jgi:hypothetical protein
MKIRPLSDLRWRTAHPSITVDIGTPPSFEGVTSQSTSQLDNEVDHLQVWCATTGTFCELLLFALNISGGQETVTGGADRDVQLRLRAGAARPRSAPCPARGVTAHPTAAWSNKVRDAFPRDDAPGYLRHDRDLAFDGLGHREGDGD